MSRRTSETGGDLSDSRRFRILASSLASGANIAVFIVYQLVSLPIFLASYGDRLYADWLVMYGLPALLSVSDLGIPDVIASKMTMLRAGGELSSAAALYHRLTVLARLWMGGLLLVLVGLVWLLPWVNILGLHAISMEQARLTLTALSCWLCMNLYWGVYSAGYQASKQFHRNLRLIACGRAAEATVIVTAVASGVRMWEMASALVCVKAVMTVVVRRDVNRTTPWKAELRQMSKASRGSASLKGLRTAALASLAYPAGTAIQNQGMLLVVSLRAGAAAVVTVNSVRTITNAVYQFNTLVKAGVTPELSDRFGVGAISEARDVAQKVTAIISAANLLFAGVMVVVGPIFLRYWSSHHVSVSPGLMALFAASAATDCLWLSMENVAQAQNRHQRIGLAYVTACLVALPVSYIFMPALGLTAVAAALFSTSILVTLVTVPWACALLETTPREYCRGALIYLVSLVREPPFRRWLAERGV